MPNAVYSSEGDITFKGGNSASNAPPNGGVTMVTMGMFYLHNDSQLYAPDRLDPVILAAGDVQMNSGHAYTAGTIWAGGNFLIKNGAIAEGRVETNGFTQSNGTLTDSADPNVYQFLNGFSYNPLAAGWLLTYTGWGESWQ